MASREAERVQGDHHNRDTYVSVVWDTTVDRFTKGRAIIVSDGICVGGARSTNRPGRL